MASMLAYNDTNGDRRRDIHMGGYPINPPPTHRGVDTMQSIRTFSNESVTLNSVRKMSDNELLELITRLGSENAHDFRKAEDQFLGTKAYNLVRQELSERLQDGKKWRVQREAERANRGRGLYVLNGEKG